MTHPTTGNITASRKLGDLRARTGSAVILVAFALGATWAGGLAFALFWCGAAIVILWEWQRMIGAERLAWRVAAGGVGLLALTILPRADGALDALVVVVFGVFEACLGAPGRRIWAASGFAYAALFVVATVALRASVPVGERAIMWLFAVVLVDRCLRLSRRTPSRRPKLWPRVSPSKTWSGTLSGVIAGGAFGAALALFGIGHRSAVVPIFLLSAAAAIVSQAGDAFESAMKRRFGVKDSSGLIPGHGGVMDRLDGFVVAAAFAFVIGTLRNPSAVALGLFHWD